MRQYIFKRRFWLTFQGIVIVGKLFSEFHEIPIPQHTCYGICFNRNMQFFSHCLSGKVLLVALIGDYQLPAAVIRDQIKVATGISKVFFFFLNSCFVFSPKTGETQPKKNPKKTLLKQSLFFYSKYKFCLEQSCRREILDKQRIFDKCIRMK